MDHFLAGELAPELHAALVAHLEHCRICQQATELDASEQSLADDIRWAARTAAQTSVDVNLPLGRLNALLDDYEVLAEIGRGGMGIVYRARQLKLNRMVALKVLPALLGAVRPDAIARFRREAELAAGLEHTNIIGVYDFGEVDGTLYYAMQLIEGRSLRDVLAEIEETGAIDVVLGAGSQPEVKAQTPRPPAQRLASSPSAARAYFRRVAEWTADVAEALRYAHQRGVIHRDVKPSNLLLASDGRMMISDFGLARAAGAETISDDRTLLGTVRYMSPEQVSGNGAEIDGRVDVYGLGATLYELLAFRPMFAGADDRAVLDCVLNKEPPPPHRFVSQVPPELETICLKAVAKNRGQRYDSAQALADDLRRWLLNLPILARRPTLPTRVAKFISRRKLPVALVASLVVLLAASAWIYGAYSASKRAAADARWLAQTQSAQRLVFEARVDFMGGRYEACLRKVDEALAAQPDLMDARLLKSHLMAELGRHAEELEILDRLVADAPDDWRSHYAVVVACHKTEPVKAVYHQQQVQRLMPETTQAYMARALVEPDLQRAIDLLSRAVDLDSTSVPGYVREGVRFSRATAYMRCGEYQKAIVDYTWIAKLVDPTQAPFALLYRGWAYSRLGQFGQALADMNHAVELSPGQPEMYRVRGELHLRMQRLDEALADLKRWVDLRPNEPLALLIHAMTCELAGQRDEASAGYDRVIALGGDTAIYARLWKHLLRLASEPDGGWTPDNTGGTARTEQVLAFVDRKISAEELLAGAETDNDRAEAYYYIGRRALLDAQPEQAREAFTRCLNLNCPELFEADFARILLKQLE